MNGTNQTIIAEVVWLFRDQSTRPLAMFWPWPSRGPSRMMKTANMGSSIRICRRSDQAKSRPLRISLLNAMAVFIGG